MDSAQNYRNHDMIGMKKLSCTNHWWWLCSYPSGPKSIVEGLSSAFAVIKLILSSFGCICFDILLTSLTVRHKEIWGMRNKIVLVSTIACSKKNTRNLEIAFPVCIVISFLILFTGSQEPIEYHINDRKFCESPQRPLGQLLSSICPFPFSYYPQILAVVQHLHFPYAMSSHRVGSGIPNDP